MRVQQLVSVTIVSAAAILAGCESDIAGGPETGNPHGKYSLQSINGVTGPPWMLPIDDPAVPTPATPPIETFTLTSDSLTVDLDATAWVREEFVFTQGLDTGEWSYFWLGTWVQSGSQLTFTLSAGDGGCTQIGTWSGSRITIAEDCIRGARLVYEFSRPLNL